MNGFLRSLVLRIARFTYVPFEPSTRKSGISGLLGNVPTDQLAEALSRRRMAEIDLKSLGIDKDPRWWETVLQAGMVFAAVFQAVCIGFAMFGSSETTDSTTRRKSSSTVTEKSVSSGRRKLKQDKKRR